VDYADIFFYLKNYHYRIEVEFFANFRYFSYLLWLFLTC